MTKVLAVANQKGGVAKTTSTINIAAALAEEGRQVLLVDMDPQGNATSGLGIDKEAGMRCVYDCLINEYPLAKVCKATPVEGLRLIPATIQLAGAEVEMVGMVERENLLKNILTTYVKDYDYVMIDCPPSLGLLTLNALTAADGILIPVQCEYYALEGLGQLLNTIDLVKKHLNPKLEVFGTLLTMQDHRTNLSSQVADEVRRYFKEKTFTQGISRNVRLSEAPSYGLPIGLYDPRSKGTEQYRQVALEVISRG
ncbi:MAG: AAA family ATPase [Peptococcaceae bacterium]|jgi:chromosome partitioning protein|nr:AAA family ATPase [Peptococcaceae bacterium]